VYVIHAIIPVFAMRMGERGIWLGCPEDRGWGLFLYMTATSLALASVSWWCFERPLNDLKRFFPYVRSASVRRLTASAKAAPSGSGG
jgi:peptidoglycan/LPS O-acetylase OafA/YrhL